LWKEMANFPGGMINSSMKKFNLGDGIYLSHFIDSSFLSDENSSEDTEEFLAVFCWTLMRNPYMVTNNNNSPPLNSPAYVLLQTSTPNQNQTVGKNIPTLKRETTKKEENSHPTGDSRDSETISQSEHSEINICNSGKPSCDLICVRDPNCVLPRFLVRFTREKTEQFLKEQVVIWYSSPRTTSTNWLTSVTGISDSDEILEVLRGKGVNVVNLHSLPDVEEWFNNENNPKNFKIATSFTHFGDEAGGVRFIQSILKLKQKFYWWNTKYIKIAIVCDNKEQKNSAAKSLPKEHVTVIGKNKIMKFVKN